MPQHRLGVTSQSVHIVNSPMKWSTPEALENNEICLAVTHIIWYFEGSSLGVLRAAKCLVPNGVEHISRTALLQQCISENYGENSFLVTSKKKLLRNPYLYSFHMYKH